MSPLSTRRRASSSRGRMTPAELPMVVILSFMGLLKVITYVSTPRIRHASGVMGHACRLPWMGQGHAAEPIGSGAMGHANLSHGYPLLSRNRLVETTQ